MYMNCVLSVLCNLHILQLNIICIIVVVLSVTRSSSVRRQKHIGTI